MNRLLVSFALGVMLTVGACSSSGVNGDKGLVRFSFVGQSREAQDNAPVATNTTLRVLLQHPQQLTGTDNNTFTELKLVVKAIQGGSDAEVIPTGIAEYGVFFSKSGQYQLQAMQGDTLLDTAELQVKDPDSLIFDTTVDVATQGDNCVSVANGVVLNGLTLAANQTATVYLIPRAGNVALQGLPELTVSGTNSNLDTIASSYAITELNLSVVPTQPGQSIDLTSTDVLNNLNAKVTIATQSGKVSVSCPQ